MADFYLISEERRQPYEPRACRLIRRLRSEIRDDMALVEVAPRFDRWTYCSEGDVQQVVLAARHQGESLFPVTEWGESVYVALAKQPFDPAKHAAILIGSSFNKPPNYVGMCWSRYSFGADESTISADDLFMIDWGAIYQTVEDAQAAIQQMNGN